MTQEYPPFTDMKDVIVERPNKVCGKCNRELKIGWHVFYDGNVKKVYCKPCHAELTKAVEPPVTKSAVQTVFPLAEKLSPVGITEGQQTRELINEKTDGISFQIKNVVDEIKILSKRVDDLTKLFADMNTKKVGVKK
jgi:hypothetical protein